MTPEIDITDGVGTGRGIEAARLQPLDAVCATLDWPLSSDDDGDATIPPAVAAALGQALAACGLVAFRQDDKPYGALFYEPPLKTSIMDRLLDSVGLAPDHFGIVIVANPADIAGLFAYGGWSLAAQAALVLDPEADQVPIVAALRQGLDWRSRPLPPGARLLFGPGHDGDFAVIAAADGYELERFKRALESV